MKYVSVSGGADSTACALLLWERGIDFDMVFADTGAELPETYFMLPRLARKINKQIHVVSKGSFFQHLVNFGFMLPSFNARYCTRILKQEAMDTYFKSVNAETISVGIRADEPRRAHIKPRYEGQVFDYPLVDAGVTKDGVYELCRKHDLLSPVYEWRTNVSCFCCFFQRKSDWLGLLKHHPSLYAIAEEWERQSMAVTPNKYTWNGSYSLEELKKADEKQIKMWPEIKGEPCLICSL